MIRKDDRTPEQQISHHWLVIGTDSFMSGWGEARDGASYAAWACLPKDVDKVEQWVSSRHEMKRVRVTIDRPGARYRPKHCAHLHIYLVHKYHSAIEE